MKTYQKYRVIIAITIYLLVVSILIWAQPVADSTLPEEKPGLTINESPRDMIVHFL